MPVLSKRERLAIFLQRLEIAPSVANPDSALQLLSETLTAVENEFSGIPANAEAWANDGRMYPPTEANRRALSSLPFVRRYRSARHNTFIGANGSIRIEDIDGNILLDKAGSDGRKVPTKSESN
jgi:hypothetical protein